MLAGGLDPLYRAALARPHEPYLRVDVYAGNELLQAGIPWESGSVGATLTSRVARQLSMTVDESLFPHEADDLLNPYTRSLRVWRGVQFADGNRYRWLIFRGKITVARLSGGTATIQARDRAGEVDEAKFVAVANSNAGSLVLDEFQRLVSDGVPDATFGPSDEYWERVPILSWESDRAAALDDIADGVGSFWYPLADGEYVLRRVPWTVPAAPVLTMTDQEGGTVLASDVERSRDSVWSSVVVTGERTDGTAPVYAAVEDLNPASPTYALGPFGVKHRLVKLNSPATQDQAAAAADAWLRRSKAPSKVWAINCVPDPALELGDVVRLNVRGRSEVQVVASFTMPFDAKQNMRVGFRSQVLSNLEEA